MLMWLFPFLLNPTLSCPCNDQTSTQSSKVGHDRFRLIWPDWSFSRATRFQIQHISRLSLRRILNLFSEVLATPMLAVTYGPKKFSCHHPCIILARILQITHITLKDLSCYRLRTYRACRHQLPHRPGHYRRRERPHLAGPARARPWGERSRTDCRLR